MTDPLENMLQQIGMKTTPFQPGSRYYGIALAVVQTADKNPVLYVRRRIIPPAESFEQLQEYTVLENDRLDNIAAAYIGDPEQFWQIADWNNAIQPEALTDEAGSKLKLAQ